MNCNESFLSEVVKVAIYPTNQCTVAVPFNVPSILYLNPTLGTPSLVIGFNDDNLTAQYDKDPTLRDSSQRQAEGVIHTIDLNAPLEHGFADMRSAVKSLIGLDFNMVAYTADGTAYFCYSLPNTSRISLEEQMAENGSMTLKATINSLSGFIRISSSSSSN